AGDSFALFAASSFSGSFAALNLPVLGEGLAWDVTQLGGDGTLRVITGSSTPAVPPVLDLIHFQNGTNVLVTGAGGSSNGLYCILTTTNVALPLSNWSRLATNPFALDGRFTNLLPAVASAPKQFFALSVLPPPPPPSPAEVVISNMLVNIRDNGFD